MPRLDQLYKMLEADPNDAFLHFALGMEYLKQGQHAEAVAQFQKVSQIDANYVPAYFQQGNALVAMGNVPAAKEALTQGIAIAQQTGDRHAATEMAQTLALLNTQPGS